MIGSNGLRRNMVLLTADEGEGRSRLRILELRRDLDAVALFVLDDPTAVPYWLSLETLKRELEERTLEECEDTFQATMRRDSDLTPAELAERNRRFAAIAPIVGTDGRDDLHEARRRDQLRLRRTELDDEARREGENGRGGPRATKLLTYLRLYWRGGQLPNALVPNFSARGAGGEPRVQIAGAPKIGPRPRQSGPDLQLGVVITMEIRDLMRTSGVRLLRVRDQTVRGAYEAFTKKHFSTEVIEDGKRMWVVIPAHLRPTLRQFRYHTSKAFGHRAKLVAQKGEAAVAQRHRERIGNTGHLHFGPGSVFQIDATVADLYLRSRLEPHRLVGRPVVYLIVDMYSKGIVGFAVSLDGPRWETAAAALENAFSDKVAFCGELGINIESHQWPQRHVCAGLTGDRGWDQLSKHAGAAQELFGYKLVNLPPYRADLKGLVEDKFNFLNEVMRFQPGAWRRRPKGERPNVLDGAMTLSQFTAFLAARILKWNNTHHVEDPPAVWDYALGIPTPNMLWRHGVVAHGAPDMAEPSRIRHALLRSGTARVGDAGIRFNQQDYVPASEGDVMPGDAHLRFERKKWKSVEVRYSEADVTRILVPVNRAQSHLTYVLVDTSTHRGWTMQELQDWNASTSARRREAVDRDARERAHWDAETAALDRRAKSDGSNAIPKTKRPVVDTDARDAEIRMQRRDQAATAFDGVATGADAPGDPGAGQSKRLSLRPNRIDLLERASARALDATGEGS